MGVPPVSSSDGGGGLAFPDAESLFRAKPISEIRNVEAATRSQIQSKQLELRQLVGTRYRDLIDSADSIVLMKSSCQSISSNLSSIRASLRSLSSSNSSETVPNLPLFPNPARANVYGIACRVKYLIDTPENIWGCLDESMFLEAAARYVRAKQVQKALTDPDNYDNNDANRNILAKFPLLQHQWLIVESFRAQISQRSRERLIDRGVALSSYIDALTAIALIDELDPKQILGLFLETRKSWISHILGTCSSNANSSLVVSIFCEVLRIMQISVAQVGESFLHVLNDMPLFYKVILRAPPASQLFGGIPNPDEEVRLWNLFRDKLESIMIVLNKDFIARSCSSWLRECGRESLSQVNGKFLIDAISSGQELASAEKLIRETMESKEVLEGSLEWLKSVFGSEIELPWRRVRELVLEDNSDLWDEIFEDAFTQRMKSIMDLRFENLNKVVKVADSVLMIGDTFAKEINFQGYLSRASTGGEFWFVESHVKKGCSGVKAKALSEENLQSCLDVYFGNEVNRIRDAVDSCCQSILEDLLIFLESPKAAIRLKHLAPYLQNKCYENISGILKNLESEVDNLSTMLDKSNEGLTMSPAVMIERSLFIGRILFAFQYHSRHIPVVLGPPRFWINDSLSAVLDKIPSLLRLSRADTDAPGCESPRGRKILGGTRKQSSLAAAALFGASDSESPKLEELSRFTQNLCRRSYNLWISWFSQELSIILSQDLHQDESLSSTMPLRGWEETVVKQGQFEDGQSEVKIALPTMPSLYILSFLFQACEEIHKIGGHVLEKSILQKFALKLMEKVLDIYADFHSSKETGGFQVSEKGILQILLDIKFVADILSGGDSGRNEEIFRKQRMKVQFRRKDDHSETKSLTRERLHGLINCLSQILDPIDWLTYEPYLWENERQAYLRHAVLFGFFVQLNRMYTDTVQKLPTNSESNIMRCSMVPRFKYLPISAPALTSRGATKASHSNSSDDLSINSWKDYANGELSRKIDLDDNSNLGVAAPLLKSFMQIWAELRSQREMSAKTEQEIFGEPQPRWTEILQQIEECLNVAYQLFETHSKVGSKFGESTLKLGSMLTDGQVGIFKDKSAAAMSTFGDILPAQAAGLLSSFTPTRSDS